MKLKLIPGTSRLIAVLGVASLVALAVGCTPTTEVTVAGNGASGEGIVVSGEGTVSVRPDIAVVNVGVEVTTNTVAEARSDAADAMQAIRDALEAEGVAEEDIQTQYFNIYPQYRHDEGEAPTITGFTVSNTVRINVRDLDTVSNVLDAAIAAGGDAVRVNGISFTVENPDEFLDDARRAAVENARQHAEILADAAGVELGDPLSISESRSGGGDDILRQEAADAGAGGATPISPGEQELRLNVSVRYAIAD